MSDEIKVHILEAEASHDIYAVTQCGYLDEAGVEIEIRDGDVFVVPSRGVIGFLCAAWPIAILYSEDDSAGLHVLDWETRDASPEHPAVQYEASILKCCELGEADADVTGNHEWTTQAESVRKLIDR